MIRKNKSVEWLDYDLDTPERLQEELNAAQRFINILDSVFVLVDDLKSDMMRVSNSSTVKEAK